MCTTNTLSIMCAILVGLTSTMASAAFAATQSSPTNNLKPANKKALFQKEKSVKKSLDYIHRTGLDYCSVWMQGRLAALYLSGNRAQTIRVLGTCPDRGILQCLKRLISGFGQSAELRQT